MKSYAIDTSVSFPNIPEELRSHPQWVNWQRFYDRARDKWKKVPINPATGGKAKPSDPGTWATLSEAAAVLAEEHGCRGVGFMLTRDDPYTVIDLDNCRDPETGVAEPWALEIVRTFGSITFVSPSGKGLHIWVTGTLPVAAHTQCVPISACESPRASLSPCSP